MPTVAHRPFRLPGRTPHRLTMWLLGAVLVAAVATTIALSAVTVELACRAEPPAVEITATCRARGPTGVEMEALTAVSAALVAAVATALALSLIGSGDQPTTPSVDAPQAAPEPPTQWGGARR